MTRLEKQGTNGGIEMKRYFVFDGVESEIDSYHDSIEAATKALKKLIDESNDGYEWMDGVENSFVGEIKFFAKSVVYEDDADGIVKMYTEYNVEKYMMEGSDAGN